MQGIYVSCCWLSWELFEKLLDMTGQDKILIWRDKLRKQEDFENESMYILLSIYFSPYTCHFYKKTIFCLSPNFFNKMLEIRLRFS